MCALMKTLKAHTPQIHESVFVAESASIIGQVEVSENASLWYNCVLRGDIDYIRIGRNSNIQDGVIVHVDRGQPCIVGDNVTVGHNAILHGCKVCNNCLIGMGAIILNNAVVEEGAQVGAGSVVPPGRVVTAGTLYLGIPAKKVRNLTDDDRKHMNENIQIYLQLAKGYFSGR